MSPQAKKVYLTPEKVGAARARMVLAFLNTARTVQEIAEAIEVKGERDVGIRVAQNILDRRAQLHGFKDLRQVLNVPQIGPERFTEIVNALESKKDVGTSYIIEGQIKSLGKIDFGKVKLAVHAFVNSIEVASAAVDAQGKYKLTFEYTGAPPATELRLLPAKLSFRSAHTLALSKAFSPHRYVLKQQSAGVYFLNYDWILPSDAVLLWQTVTKTYHMQGTVWATTFSSGMPFLVVPLPAAKIEFYEVDAGFWIYGTEPETTEAHLGYVYTALDGSYDFQFDFSYADRPGIFLSYSQDKVPDIRARISQFQDGSWLQIYEGPVDWNIVEPFYRHYFVPVEDTIPIPDGGVKPNEGFRFVSVGLLPIDTTRIQLGYATSQTGDPIGLSHQPFCGTLRIFGLFAEAPPVASYKVQVAPADEDSPVGSWQDVIDALHNLKWNNASNQWEFMVLGPDPTTGRYQNIDIEPEADWHEHALKVTLNTANRPNGYYALRIIGYDATGAELGTFEMPIVRIDNTIPETSLEVIGTALGEVTECGALVLGVDRKIQFKVTAHDPEGHVLKYQLSGSRGKAASQAGDITVEQPDGSLMEQRPNPASIWTGVDDKTVDFKVAPLPLALSGCPSVAYNFELFVYGLATDGYNVEPQWTERETNLVVSET